MIRFHTKTNTYNLRLRGEYSQIKSEKAFRAMVDSIITSWEIKKPLVGAVLRSKWTSGYEFDVINVFLELLTYRKKIK